jgi:hypothetical protein
MDYQGFLGSALMRCAPRAAASPPHLPPADQLSDGAARRLRPTPLHSDSDIEALVAGLGDIWARLTLRRAA